VLSCSEPGHASPKRMRDHAARPPGRPWHGPARGTPPSGDSAQVHGVAGRQAASCGSVGADADRERRQDFSSGQVSQVRAQARRPVDAARIPVLARPPLCWLQEDFMCVTHTRQALPRPRSRHLQRCRWGGRPSTTSEGRRRRSHQHAQPGERLLRNGRLRHCAARMGAPARLRSGAGSAPARPRRNVQLDAGRETDDGRGRRGGHPQAEQRAPHPDRKGLAQLHHAYLRPARAHARMGAVDAGAAWRAAQAHQAEAQGLRACACVRAVPVLACYGAGARAAPG